MKRNKLVIGLMVLVLILAACSPAAGVNFPTGKFIKSGEADYGMQFNADGTFSVFRGSTTYVTGTYEVKGDVFTETSNDGGCDTNIDFNYTFDGSNLTFNYADDPNADTGCSGRYSDFNNVTYTLAK